jgi:AraC-like DNA-binding protein
MTETLTIRSIFYRDAPSNYQTPDHTHEGNWQWYLVRHGDVTQTIDGTTYELAAGDSILIPPRAVRSPRCTGMAPSYTMAIFHPGPITLWPLAKQILPIHQPTNFEELIKELAHPEDGYAELVVNVVFTRLLIGHVREHRESADKATTEASLNELSENDLCQRAIAFMRAQMHEPISRNDIAAAVHYSEPHFARVFKRIMGVTPGHYLSNLRLERAKLFLRSSTLSIGQIALEVGFQSFSHFTQLFKKEVGSSPSSYRKGDLP